MTSVRRLLVRLAVAGAACVSVLGMTGRAHAWKPYMHVQLAEEARKDLIDDGQVEIDSVDFWAQRPNGKLGTFKGDPRIVAALKAYPEYYRAGVLGPDAYPDILFGQMTIHPEPKSEDANQRGSDAWLTRLYDLALASGDGRKIAFALGFMAHAAGDMYGHTFINQYAGGPYELGMNAVRHISLEGYVAKHTPTYDPSSGYTISTAGIDDSFIYEALVNGLRSRDGLTKNDVWRWTENTWKNSPVGLGMHLRAGLLDQIDAYYQYKAYLQSLSDKYWSECGIFDLDDCAMGLWVDTQLAAYTSVKGLQITYVEHWSADVTRGLQYWPATSTKVGASLMMSPTRAMDLDGAGAALTDYFFKYGCSMLGAPDAVCSFGDAVRTVIDALVPEFSFPLFEQWKADFVNAAVTTVTGKSKTEWKALFEGEKLDELFPGKRAEIDAMMAVPTGAALTYPYKLEAFAPAFNTRTAIKLSFLDPTTRQLNALLGSMGWAMLGGTTTNFPNALLGYIPSLDGWRQWQSKAATAPAWGEHGFPLSNDCHLYSRVFMQQPGDQHDATNAVWNTAATACNGATPTLTLAPASACGGAATATVSLPNPAPKFGAVVKLADRTGFASTPKSVYVPAGANSASVAIPTGGNGLPMDLVATRLNMAKARLTPAACSQRGPYQSQAYFDLWAPDRTLETTNGRFWFSSSPTRAVVSSAVFTSAVANQFAVVNGVGGSPTGAGWSDEFRNDSTTLCSVSLVDGAARGVTHSFTIGSATYPTSASATACKMRVHGVGARGWVAVDGGSAVAVEKSGALGSDLVNGYARSTYPGTPKLIPGTLLANTSTTHRGTYAIDEGGKLATVVAGVTTSLAPSHDLAPRSLASGGDLGVFAVQQDGYLQRVYKSGTGWAASTFPWLGARIVPGSLVAIDGGQVAGVLTNGRVFVTGMSGTSVVASVLPYTGSVVPRSLGYAIGNGLFAVNTSRQLVRLSGAGYLTSQVVLSWGSPIVPGSIVPLGDQIAGLTESGELFVTWTSAGAPAFAFVPGVPKFKPLSLASHLWQIYGVDAAGNVVNVYWDGSAWTFRSVAPTSGAVRPGTLVGFDGGVMGLNVEGEMFRATRSSTGMTYLRFVSFTWAEPTPFPGALDPAFVDETATPWGSAGTSY